MSALDATRAEVESLRDRARSAGLAPLAEDCDALLAGVARAEVVVRVQAAIEIVRRT